MTALPALKRILVAPLRFVGDTVLTVPLLRGIHQQFPDSQMDVLTNAVCGSLLSESPYVHQIIEEAKSKLTLIQQLKAGQYDAVLILRKSFSLALICRLAGIPVTIGYDKQRFPWGYRRTGWLLHRAVRYPSLRTTDYQAQSNLQFLNVLRTLFQTSPDSSAIQHDPNKAIRLELWRTPEDDAAVQSLLNQLKGLINTPGSLGDDQQRQPIALVHAVSASHGKSIAPEKFISAIQQLQSQGYAILFTGTKADSLFYETLIQRVQHGKPPAPTSTNPLDPTTGGSDIANKITHSEGLYNIAGQTTLRQLVALCHQADLMLTLDSGPLHIGAACGIKTLIGIFGPTNEQQWGVYQPGVDFRLVLKDLPCRPCYAKVCEHNNCREQISAEDILAALNLSSPII